MLCPLFGICVFISETYIQTLKKRYDCTTSYIPENTGYMYVEFMCKKLIVVPFKTS